MKKYQIIYADPPWSYNDKLGSTSAKMGACEYHYKTMSLEDICSLPINSIADDNCILFLWVTMPKLQEAFKVIDSWGFKHKTTAFVWIKLNPKANTIFKGIGRWVQGNAELVLLATKGKPKRISKSVSQVVMAKRGKTFSKTHRSKKSHSSTYGGFTSYRTICKRKNYWLGCMG
jgi:site-specific DNA-methyltransferase (adenine-specific)